MTAEGARAISKPTPPEATGRGPMIDDIDDGITSNIAVVS